MPFSHPIWHLWNLPPRKLTPENLISGILIKIGNHMKNQFYSSEILTDIEQKLKIKVDERISAILLVVKVKQLSFLSENSF